MSEFFAITFLILLASISPGPDFAMVTKNSLMYSRKEGLLSALGISISLLIHATYCIFGLAIVISQSLLAFSVIKYLGASYMIYIGIKSLFAKKEKVSLNLHHTRRLMTAFQAFRQGFFCNLLNPKAIMFLLAFFTLVVKPNSSLFLEMGYGFEIAIIHLIWFSLLSYILTHRNVRSNLSRIQFYIVKIMGVVLVAFGVKIALLHRSLT